MVEPYYETWAATVAAKGVYVSDLPDWVRNWMTWMRFAYASSFWFAWSRVEARWALTVGISTLYVATGLAYFVGWGLLWGSVHILLWTPLMIYLFLRRGAFNMNDAYSIWLHGLMTTIFVSLIFDIRDVFLYFSA
ncbi:MAG: hypothetical protein ACE5GZ_08185 [Gammaproteobacteria bacterium]